MLRLGGHLVAAGDFADGHAVLRLVEFGDQLVEQVADALGGLLERGGDLRQRERLFGHIDDGLEHRPELGILLGDRGGRFVQRGVARSHQLVDRDGGASASGGSDGLRAAASGRDLFCRLCRFRFRAYALRG